VSKDYNTTATTAVIHLRADEADRFNHLSEWVGSKSLKIVEVFVPGGAL